MNKEIEQNFNEIEKEFAHLAKLKSSLAKLIDDKKFVEFVSGNESEATENDSQFISKYHYLMSQFRGRTEKLHYYLCSEPEANSEIDDGTFIDISFCAGNDYLILKLPMIQHRNDTTVISNGHMVIKPYSGFGKKALMEKLNFIEKNNICDFNSFRYKTVYYIFVYSSKDESHIADSDNHDTKVIHDVICSKTPAQDANQYCRVIYDTVVSDCVAGGTYIALLKGKEQTKSAEWILNCWQSKKSG